MMTTLVGGLLGSALLFGADIGRPVAIGDVVIAIEAAEVRDDGRAIGMLDVGNPLVVGAIEGDRLWVNFAQAGWIEAAKTASPAEAIRIFSDQLAEQADRAEIRLARGRALAATGDLRSALDDVSQAVDLAPDDVRPYLIRSRLHQQLGDAESALADLATAAKIAPDDAQVYRLRAALEVTRGRFAEAIADYNRAVRFDPGNGAVANDRAWLLATCPAEQFRNGPLAVEDAYAACKQSNWRTHNRLGTLAAALAETGEFDEAVHWQKKAIALAPPSHAAEARARLQLYQAGKPYREYVPHRTVAQTTSARSKTGTGATR